MELVTRRTRLRFLAASDVDSLVALDADPLVMRFISGGASIPKAVYVDEILPRLLGYPLVHPGMGFFAIESRADGASPADGDFLGWAHLRPDHLQPAWAEVGYRLRRQHWGQGIAPEVTQALLAHAFETLGCATVSARTHRDNVASRRVMEKSGLELAGAFEYPGTTVGTVEFPPAPCVLYLRHR